MSKRLYRVSQNICKLLGHTDRNIGTLLLGVHIEINVISMMQCSPEICKHSGTPCIQSIIQDFNFNRFHDRGWCKSITCFHSKFGKYTFSDFQVCFGRCSMVFIHNIKFKLQLHGAICRPDSFVFAQDY